MRPLIPPLSSSHIWWEDEQGPLLFEMDLDLSIFLLKAVQILTRTRRGTQWSPCSLLNLVGLLRKHPGLYIHGWENKSSTHWASTLRSTLLGSRKWSSQMVWHRESFPWRSFPLRSQWMRRICEPRRGGSFLIRRLAYEKAPGWSQQDTGGTFILFIFLRI